VALHTFFLRHAFLSFFFPLGFSKEVGVQHLSATVDLLLLPFVQLTHKDFVFRFHALSSFWQRKLSFSFHL
jgi:hypothetical protein